MYKRQQYASFSFEVQPDYSAEYAEGVVYDQSPKAPKRVKANATVTLYVSKGTQVVSLPDVLGKDCLLYTSRHAPAEGIHG